MLYSSSITCLPYFWFCALRHLAVTLTLNLITMSKYITSFGTALFTVVMLFAAAGGLKAQNTDSKRIVRIIEADSTGERVIKEIELNSKTDKISVDRDNSSIIIDIDAIGKSLQQAFESLALSLDSMTQNLPKVRVESSFDNDYIWAKRNDGSIEIKIPPFPDFYFFEEEEKADRDWEKILEELEEGTFKPENHGLSAKSKSESGNFKAYSHGTKTEVADSTARKSYKIVVIGKNEK